MKRKPPHRDVIAQVRTILVAMFPQTFAPEGHDKTPLKIGIFNELSEILKAKAPGISSRVLRATLADYTGGIRYLRNMKPGSPRIDLNGEQAGIITDEEAANAKIRLQNRLNFIDKMKKKSRRSRIGENTRSTFSTTRRD